MLYTDNDNTFGQVSGGLEALSQYFDVRVNGYYPFSDPEAVEGMAEVELKGDTIFMTGRAEVPLYGVDGEIGGRLPLASGNSASLGVYGGGFWFDHDDIEEAVAGGTRFASAPAARRYRDRAGARSRRRVSFGPAAPDRSSRAACLSSRATPGF